MPVVFCFHFIPPLRWKVLHLDRVSSLKVSKYKFTSGTWRQQQPAAARRRISFSSLLSARGKWCCALIGCWPLTCAPSCWRTVRAARSAQSALLPVIPHRYLPLLHTQTHTHTHTLIHSLTHTHIHTLTLMSARCVCAHHRLLQPATDFTWANKPRDLTTKPCAHTALCGIAGYYYFCALSGGNGGGVSARAITMDCLFLLIWTLPIPLVGCTSLRLLSTLLSWNIIKACALYQPCMHPSVKHTHRLSVGPKQTHICLFSAWFVPTPAAALTECGEK